MNASNGQDLTLLPPYQYTITADLSPLFYVEEWLTTAGSLTSSTSNPTLFTPNGSGTLYLIALDEHTQGGWVGYIYSISGLTGEVTSISGTFILPTATEMGFGIWMGIGGMTGTDLWQAGVQVNKSGTVAPWYEAYVPGGNQTVEYGHSFPIALGDKVEVTVTSDGGICTFAIQDLSRPGQPTWSGHDVNKFYPNAQTGEWIMEPKTTPSSQLDIPVSNMTFNGGFSVYASYMDIEYTWGTSQGGYLDYYGSALVAGYPNFSIESSG
ncbi:MAG TPA: G1 family glutamic endopeptidase [Thermoplasmata archaeon]|nr:G1 family glutamic endopeptidase [Thermoplasmata archaeon]